MFTLAKSAQTYFNDYVRGGGKDSRRKQVKRIIEFLDWVELTERVISLHSLGKNHVIGFWKFHRHLSDGTAYKYWLGISKLWEWLGKHDAPPKPFKRNGEIELSSIDDGMCHFSEISQAVKFARESKKMPVLKLANLSGCESIAIENLESGESDISFSDLQILLKILNIHLTVRMFP